MSMEPVAWASPNGRLNNIVSHKRNGTFTVPLVRLSDAEARIAELEALVTASEKDRYCTNFKLLKRAEAAEALLKEAGKALEPFASCSSEWDDEDDALHVFLEWEDGTPAQSLPVVDFRAARAIHDKIGVKDE